MFTKWHSYCNFNNNPLAWFSHSLHDMSWDFTSSNQIPLSKRHKIKILIYVPQYNLYSLFFSILQNNEIYKIIRCNKKRSMLSINQKMLMTPKTEAEVRMIKVKWWIRHMVSKDVMHVHIYELILYVMLFFTKLSLWKLLLMIDWMFIILRHI